MAYTVTAISWGPWRAEFIRPVDGGHEVYISKHRKRGHPKPSVIPVVVARDDEHGLREAIFAHARRSGEPLVPYHDANDFWLTKLAEEEFREQ